MLGDFTEKADENDWDGDNWQEERLLWDQLCQEEKEDELERHKHVENSMLDLAETESCRREVMNMYYNNPPNEKGDSQFPTLRRLLIAQQILYLRVATIVCEAKERTRSQLCPMKKLAYWP